MAKNIERSSQSNIYFSNKLEVLFIILKHNLFKNDSTPFSNRLILIPSHSMEDWVQMRLAEDLLISSGITTLFLNQATNKIVAEMYETQPHCLPSDLELSLRLEEEISKILISTDLIWKPLLTYLEGKERRLRALVKHLAPLFHRYGIYGNKFIKQWENEPRNWQEALWQKIYTGQNAWEYPLRQLSGLCEIKKRPHDLSVHLFSFSYIPPLYFTFFQKLSQEIPIFFYQLSPCKEFWSDLIPDSYEINLLQNIGERNAILANLGKIGRVQARLVEESAIESFEAYVETPEASTQLEHIQQRLLDLEPCELAFEDDSIQVHVATTCHREVEIAYNLILQIMERDKLQPIDFLVMAPDISRYAESIQALFDQEIDFQIHDMSVAKENLHIRGLISLIELDSKRWSAPALLQLFHHKLFLKKQGWSPEDVELIQSWIQHTGIRWGIDLNHRNEILHRTHCEQPPQDEGATWQKGFDRLLEELVTNEKNQINLTESILLGNLISVIYDLRRHLMKLSNSKKETVSVWISMLKSMDETFFSYSEFREEFHAILDKFINSTKQISKYSYLFTSFWDHFRDFLFKETFILGKNRAQAVRFCSLSPMRAIPSKILILIGMNEETFPRKDQTSGFDLLPKGEAPSRTDFDRYIFIEALLSARKKLILIYQSSEGQTQENPSSVVQEIIPYISKKQIFIHPARSYDPRYFFENSTLKNYSESNFKLALASLKQKNPHRFFPEFFSPENGEALEKDINKEDRVISISDLSQLIRSPLKFYFQKRLNLFYREDKIIKSDEEFTLTPLHLGQIKKTALRSSLDTVLAQANQETWIPSGYFHQLATNQIKETIHEQNKILKLLEINKNDFVSIKFLQSQKIPQQQENGNWLLPPLHVKISSTQTCYVVGEIEGVTPRGLYVREKGDLVGAVKSWPQFLILNAISFPLPYRLNRICFGKNGIEKEIVFSDKELCLKKLIDYYFFAKSFPSPLYPAWIFPLIKGDQIRLEKQMHADLTQGFGASDSLLRWALRGNEIPSARVLIDKWQKKAQDLFGSMIDAWF